jgi:hypothetical protein
MESALIEDERASWVFTQSKLNSFGRKEATTDIEEMIYRIHRI